VRARDGERETGMSLREVPVSARAQASFEVLRSVASTPGGVFGLGHLPRAGRERLVRHGRHPILCPPLDLLIDVVC
jgi:hypothetical protein